MLKGQRFSSLFRHYAKYHGLRKEDLEYYFVNPLENEDTPETVQLQRGDTIMVRKRRKPQPPEVAADDDDFFQDMRELLEDEEHMDAFFMVHPQGADQPVPENMIKIAAHKCILTARTEYFKALFRKGATVRGGVNTSMTFKESSENTIAVEPEFNVPHIRWTMEFIYTNRISTIKSLTTDDLLSLLNLSDKWLLRDLKKLVEHELIRNHMTVHTVGQMYRVTEDYNASRLSRACIEFIMKNLRQVTGNSSFQEDMKNHPHLCIPVLKAAADLIPEGPVHKKQKTDSGAGSSGVPTTSAGGQGLRSSPVPDSDT